MKNFSIRELSELSGIKAPTIRVWEKRYTVFIPRRSDGNIRQYTVDELDKLLALSLLSNHRYRISRLAAMSGEELQLRLSQLTNDASRFDRMIHRLLVSMYNMDVEAFEAVLDECFISWPSGTVVQKILFPFLEKVNLLYEGRRRNEEHLVVTVIRRKLHWSIEQIPVPQEKGKTILLFLSGERQLDLLLLYFYYQLKSSGWQVVYMGDDISLKNIEEILRLKKPPFLLTYGSRKAALSLTVLAERVSSIVPNAVVLLVETNRTGSGIATAYKNVKTLNCHDAINLLTES